MMFMLNIYINTEKDNVILMKCIDLITIVHPLNHAVQIMVLKLLRNIQILRLEKKKIIRPIKHRTKCNQICQVKHLSKLK